MTRHSVPTTPLNPFVSVLLPLKATPFGASASDRPIPTSVATRVVGGFAGSHQLLDEQWARNVMIKSSSHGVSLSLAMLNFVLQQVAVLVKSHGPVAGSRGSETNRPFRCFEM